MVGHEFAEPFRLHHLRPSRVQGDLVNLKTQGPLVEREHFFTGKTWVFPMSLGYIDGFVMEHLWTNPVAMDAQLIYEGSDVFCSCVFLFLLGNHQRPG